jgi:hypothetical protein
MEQLPRWPVQQGTLELMMNVIYPIPDMASRHFSYCPDEMSLTSLSIFMTFIIIMTKYLRKQLKGGRLSFVLLF